MRSFLLVILITLFPFAAGAVEAPPGQIGLDATKVLRGNFVEEHQVNVSQAPLRSSGHFVVAPTHGLIWGIEQPFPTLTIVTPTGAAQDFGGMAIKLPIKNLRHLYDVVGGALAGDWNGLETDFVITPSGKAPHWAMLLTPRPGSKPNLPYATITVSGTRFVEKIVMTTVEGNYDALTFTDPVLSPTPLTSQENLIFNEVKQ